MDTLIFGGLLVGLAALYRERSPALVLGVWWAVLAATALLLAHHITSGLSLGLNY
ncbi:DUF5993 family protein [Streptomyces atriruber]|uniref:DUF5993 family protein n=1 Tax=Streptomyces atriruber TaxID=545121 RepID=UPI001428BA40|nr:DUF5993 family protein [Streptomyces atriruber]